MASCAYPGLRMLAALLLLLAGSAAAQTFPCQCSDACQPPCLNASHPAFGVAVDTTGFRGSESAMELPYSNPVFEAAPIEQVFVHPSGNWGNSYWVTWHSQSRITPSIVYLSTDGGATWPLTFRGSAQQHKFMDYVSGWIHKVNCTGLQYATKYWYKIGKNPSYVSTFTTAPPANQSANTGIKFAVAGDLGQMLDTVATLEKFRKTIAAGQLFLLPGDFSYADNFMPRWDTWGRMLSRYLNDTPWIFCYGNHEIELVQNQPQYGQPGGQHQGFYPSDMRFAGPTKASTSALYDVPGNLFSSTNYGPVHFVSLNSYYTWAKYTSQTTWLQNDLAAANRNRANVPWIIVYLHAPWYNSFVSHFTETETVRTFYEPILRANAVDLVIHGHTHAYERYTNLYNYRYDPCGPVYFTAGTGGHDADLEPNLIPAPVQNLFRDPGNFGIVTVEIFNSTTGEIKYYRNNDPDGVAADTATIYSHASNLTYCKSAASYPEGQHPSYTLPWTEGTTNSWYPIK